MVIKAQDGLLN